MSWATDDKYASLDEQAAAPVYQPRAGAALDQAVRPSCCAPGNLKGTRHEQTRKRSKQRVPSIGSASDRIRGGAKSATQKSRTAEGRTIGKREGEIKGRLEIGNL
jgi:hypothetical protein